MLQSSLEDAIRGVPVTQNELSLMSKPPPETIIIIPQFVADPRTRESMFEIVKTTHICRTCGPQFS